MSRRKRQKRRTPPGSPPGTLVADPTAPKPVITVIAYGSDGCSEQAIRDVADVQAYLARWPVTWINVDGLGDVQTIARLADILGLHRLAVEDTINTHQRAKVEHYPNHLFMVAHMATYNDHLDTEQLSLYLGRNFVVTFQGGQPGDPFDPVRERIRRAVGHVRQSGADHLAYCLIDAVIDGYFPVLETTGERLEVLEDEILGCPTSGTSARVHEIKRNLMTLRRAIWPLREAMNSLVRDPSPLVNDETRLYLRDCYDHTVRVIDFIETYRELGSDLMDLYLSSVSQRMTEVMKVLTIIATIFIPLTFISSIYGMNFQTDRSPWNMPELTWYFGYPFALGLMAMIALAMLYYFGRKGWLRSPGEPPRSPGPPDQDRNVSDRIDNQGE
ncbi:MAG TPA: magnesium/cobalt transporter CorA [Phycisphaerae bacterium]|nr:magnesium/cobalt transporter CorA [Phycisphaerae bacterium]